MSQLAVIVFLEARVGALPKPAGPLVVRYDWVGGRVESPTDLILGTEGLVGEVSIAFVSVAVTLVRRVVS